MRLSMPSFFSQVSILLAKAAEEAYAINEEANNHVKGADTYEIRVEEGVYYFGKAVKIWGMFNLNGVYGKTVFVTET